MSRWTAADIPDQRGRLAVVTGANGGLGYQTTLRLVERGASVVMACRDERKGLAALERIRDAVPDARADVRVLDLAALESVRSFAATVEEPLDLLVNNAGVMAIPYGRTRDGFEMQLGINHLGHFALTGLVLERLLAARAARVVTVSSVFHRGGRIALEDLQSERGYDRWRAYAQSKLANLLFCLELQRRADAAGAPLTSLAAHPGYAATDLQLRGPRMEGSRARELVARVANRVLAQDPARGALPMLCAATVDVGGGTYVGPGGIGGLRGDPEVVSMADAARAPPAARRLWEVSEELTGVSYPFA